MSIWKPSAMALGLSMLLLTAARADDESADAVAERESDERQESPERAGKERPEAERAEPERGEREEAERSERRDSEERETDRDRHGRRDRRRSRVADRDRPEHARPDRPRPPRPHAQHDDGGRGRGRPDRNADRRGVVDLDLKRPDARERIELQRLSERDPKMFELEQANRELERKTVELAEIVRRKGGAAESGLAEQMTALVRKHFEVRQQRRKLELQRLEKQLDRMRHLIERRDEAADTIIENRVSELLGEDSFGF